MTKATHPSSRQPVARRPGQLGYGNAQRAAVSALSLLIGYVAIYSEALPPLGVVLLLTALFVVLVALEYQASRELFLALPPTYFAVQVSLSIFLSGVLYYAQDRGSITQFFASDSSILWGVWCTLLALQCLWIGFYAVRRPLWGMLRLSPIDAAPLWVIYLLLLVFGMSVILGIATGNFGYVAPKENTEYVGLVRYGMNCGLVAISLLRLYHYGVKRKRALLYAVVVVNMVVGLLYGSKSTVVLPLLILFFTAYLCGQRLTMRALAVFAAAVVAAYAIVEPFRAYYERNRQVEVSSLPALVEVFVSASQSSAGSETDYSWAFQERMSEVTVLGRTFDFANETGYYHSEEWKHLFLSPLYGAIPRVVWSGKPLANFGLWSSVNIFGMADTTHTSITPQGYAFLVFRYPGVVLFFLLYGLLQRIGHDLYFKQRMVPVYIYCYFFVLQPSYPTWTAVSSFVQVLGLVLLVQLVRAVLRPRAAVAAGFGAREPSGSVVAACPGRRAPRRFT